MEYNRDFVLNPKLPGYIIAENELIEIPENSSHEQVSIDYLKRIHGENWNKVKDKGSNYLQMLHDVKAILYIGIRKGISNAINLEDRNEVFLHLYCDLADVSNFQLNVIKKLNKQIMQSQLKLTYFHNYLYHKSMTSIDEKSIKKAFMIFISEARNKKIYSSTGIIPFGFSTIMGKQVYRSEYGELPTLIINDINRFFLILKQYIQVIVQCNRIDYTSDDVILHLKMLLVNIFMNATYDDYKCPEIFLEKQFNFLYEQDLELFLDHQEVNLELLQSDITLKRMNQSLSRKTPHKIAIYQNNQYICDIEYGLLSNINGRILYIYDIVLYNKDCYGFSLAEVIIYALAKFEKVTYINFIRSLPGREMIDNSNRKYTNDLSTRKREALGIIDYDIPSFKDYINKIEKKLSKISYTSKSYINVDLENYYELISSFGNNSDINETINKFEAISEIKSNI